MPDDFSPGQPESTCAPLGSTTLAARPELHLRRRVLRRPGRPFLGDRRIDLRVVARGKAQRIVDTKTVVVTATPVAPADVLDVDPSSVSFGDQPFETFETRTFTVTNVWSHTISLTSDAGLPDDFSHLIDSTCGLSDKTLAPGESCTHVVGFRPTPFFEGVETATVVLTARDQATGTLPGHANRGDHRPACGRVARDASSRWAARAARRSPLAGVVRGLVAVVRSADRHRLLLRRLARPGRGS